jgi:hypothetical protein
MNDTPETDAAVIASDGQWSFILKETCQKLELERDEARDNAERYRLEANAMMMQRDEAREALMKIKEIFIDGEDTYLDFVKVGNIATDYLEGL